MATQSQHRIVCDCCTLVAGPWRLSEIDAATGAYDAHFQRLPRPEKREGRLCEWLCPSCWFRTENTD